MRHKTANGEVTASKRHEVPLRSSATADALVLKGCPNTLSLGKRYVEEGFAFEWKAGEKPALRSPDCQSFE